MKTTKLLYVIIVFFSMASLAEPEFLPKKDNGIVAMELKTGKPLWSFTSKMLCEADIEVYTKGVVVKPYCPNDVNKQENIYLNLHDGTIQDAFVCKKEEIITRSQPLYDPLKVVLANDWYLAEYPEAANIQVLQFVEPKSKRIVWEISTNSYPSIVISWGNMVYYTCNYLAMDNGFVYAFQAGNDKSAWCVDVNTLIQKQDKFKTVKIQAFDDALYLQAEAHIFMLDAKTGKLIEHMELDKEIGLTFLYDFVAEKEKLAILVKSEDILVVSFPFVVISVDIKNKKCIWYHKPDTFPHTPNPVIYDNKIIMITGSKFKTVNLPEKK